ncbi:unnamed protein product, partial [Larinioides sclopetarius]
RRSIRADGPFVPSEVFKRHSTLNSYFSGIFTDLENFCFNSFIFELINLITIFLKQNNFRMETRGKPRFSTVGKYKESSNFNSFPPDKLPNQATEISSLLLSLLQVNLAIYLGRLSAKFCTIWRNYPQS